MRQATVFNAAPSKYTAARSPMQNYEYSLLQDLKYSLLLGLREPLKNSGSHIDASHSRQPLVKGERLVRYEVNAVMKLKHCNRLVVWWSGVQSCFPGAD